MSLGPCSFEVVAKPPSTSDVSGLPPKAVLWLKQHGYNVADIKELTSGSENHGSFVEIEDCFICEKTGSVHVCDDKCQEQLLASGQKVCLISGRAVSTVLIDHEDPAGEDYDEEDNDFSGRLGRAFAAGYGCSDESELRRMWNF